jgi:hypothetical protein
MGDRSQVVERLRLEGSLRMGAGEDTSLERETVRPVGVDHARAGRVIEQRAHPLIRPLLGGCG